jgi:hypothetical protein
MNREETYETENHDSVQRSEFFTTVEAANASLEFLLYSRWLETPV